MTLYSLKWQIRQCEDFHYIHQLMRIGGIWGIIVKWMTWMVSTLRRMLINMIVLQVRNRDTPFRNFHASRWGVRLEWPKICHFFHFSKKKMGWFLVLMQRSTVSQLLKKKKGDNFLKNLKSSFFGNVMVTLGALFRWQTSVLFWQSFSQSVECIDCEWVCEERRVGGGVGGWGR